MHGSAVAAFPEGGERRGVRAAEGGGGGGGGDSEEADWEDVESDEAWRGRSEAHERGSWGAGRGRHGSAMVKSAHVGFGPVRTRVVVVVGVRMVWNPSWTDFPRAEWVV